MRRWIRNALERFRPACPRCKFQDAALRGLTREYATKYEMVVLTTPEMVAQHPGRKLGDTVEIPLPAVFVPRA